MCWASCRISRRPTTDERLRDLVQARAGDLPADTLVMVGRLMERHEERSRAIVRAFPRSRASVLAELRRLRRLLRPDPPEDDAPGEVDADADAEEGAASGGGDPPSSTGAGVDAGTQTTQGGQAARAAKGTPTLLSIVRTVPVRRGRSAVGVLRAMLRYVRTRRG